MVPKYALDNHRKWRDICLRGKACVINGRSKREVKRLGGQPVPMVRCNRCHCWKEDQS